MLSSKYDSCSEWIEGSKLAMVINVQSVYHFTEDKNREDKIPWSVFGMFVYDSFWCRNEMLH